MVISKNRILIGIVVLLSLTGCEDENPVAVYEYSPPPNVNGGWATASLQSVGMKESYISTIARNVNNGEYTEVHSVLIVKDDKLVFEEYWPGHDFSPTDPRYHGAYVQFDRNRRHNTHSVTKSITSALVGIAIQRASIHSVSDSIFAHLPNHQSLRTHGREGITIEHALKMASGLEWNEWDVAVTSSQNDLMQFNRSTDPIRYLLSKSLATEPGTSFTYNGGTVDLLGVIIANAEHTSLPTFSRNTLFEPLGITNYAWQTLSPSGMTCAHGDIYITPRDMAKFGYLFLKSGMWNGVQIISSDWVKQSTRNHISPGVSWADGYGYLWWIRTYHGGGVAYNAFRADGWGGQQIIVFPGLNMVVVFTGANYTTGVPCDQIVERYILASLQ
jgi:CubicO group peptidase (beta-lactamase class C family)